MQATITAAGGTCVTSTGGQKISVGAAIRTGLNGRLALETHPGIVAIVAAQNTVTSTGQPAGNGRGSVATTTPITPIDSSLNVSPSGG